MRERERETETERQRQRDREREKVPSSMKETGRHTDRQKDR